MQQQKKQQLQLTRSSSAGSNSGDGISIPDHLNVPRRRDSGNWSGDRNSASSSSSTTMDNPYMYIVSKMQRNAGVPKSPTSKSGELSSSSSGHYDAGYDSYSLSSTDSLPLQQGLKHNLQLAQIPEGYQPSPGDDCERLCKETDALLDKSRAAEDAGDLGTAVALCNAASSKARAAMDAPYNNPHTITIARMKHNTCVMRSRSLHRRILQEQAIANGEKEEAAPEGRHSREGSKSGQHSRQNSRDKGNHSRQNSRELLINLPIVVDKPATKSIEIYATLPKKKTLRSKATTVNVIEDEEYMLYDRPTQRTGLFGRTKRCDDDKKDKKRARSEERNKNVSKDFSIAPTKSIISSKNSKQEKQDKAKEIEVKNAQNTAASSTDQKGKKQHKIRRKLLMGGLIKRKNRSMPDLREGQNAQQQVASNQETTSTLPKQTVDDSNVGLKANEAGQSLSGYLSEGHLEFTGNAGNNQNTGNPNLERSKLMRKRFHGSAGKALHVAKVPPPPPLRTTSQLSKSKCSGEVHNEHQMDNNLAYPINDGQCVTKSSQDQVTNAYWSHTSPMNYNQTTVQNCRNYNDYSKEPQSLPFLPSYENDGTVNPSHCMVNQSNNNYPQQKPRIQDDVVQYANGNFYEPTYVVTRADVHSEQSPGKIQLESLPPYPENSHISHSRQVSEEFPPPPYPVIASVTHSRQPSEDFPPPPSPLEVENATLPAQIVQNAQQIQQIQQVQAQQRQQQIEAQQISSLLAQLQMKRDQMLATDNSEKRSSYAEMTEDDEKNSGETWLRELQAKQAERRAKKSGPLDGQDVPKTIARRTSDLIMNGLGQIQNGQSNGGHDVTDFPKVVSSVKDMAARFEQIKLQPPAKTDEVKNQNSGHHNSSSPAFEYSTETSGQIEEISNQVPLSSENSAAFAKSDDQSVLNSSFDSSSSQSTFVTAPSVVSGCQQDSGLNAAILSMSLTLPHENGLPIDYPEDDISEIAMQNTIQNTTILPNEDDIAPRKPKNRVGKKKSVSFCDQVVLVATAEDDEKDSYMPNPILERVLRSAMNKPETAQVLREIRCLQEAEMHRDISPVTKFQQHTLPLKSEADSTPATPFQDQLRSVNFVAAVSEPSRLTPTRQNSNESGHDIGPQQSNYPSLQNQPKISYSPQLQQPIRYSQNGIAPYNQILSSSPQNYPQTHTSHPRNQGIPMSQMQKPASPYTVQTPNPYQTVPQPQQKQPLNNNTQKNGYQTYYQMEQQHNQMNKQLTAQIQPQQIVQNPRISSVNSSPITVQHNQQFGYPANQSPNPYQQYGPNQNSQNSYQGYAYQNGTQQNRGNQPLPQYQPPPNPANYQQQQNIQQQNHLQIPPQNYHQRPQQKIEQQNVLAPNQTYPNPLQNGQIQSNMKYPNYQHPPVSKQAKQIQFQANGKPQNGIVQPIVSPAMQKSASTGTMPRTGPCHLCRKKQITEPAMYCSDCDFYMSRFRPKN